MVKPPPLNISELIEISRILAAPGLQPLFLNLPGSVASQKARRAARLEVVSNSDHQVHSAADGAPGKALPGIAGKATRRVLQLTNQRISHPTLVGTVIHRESLVRQTVSGSLVEPAQLVSFAGYCPNPVPAFDRSLCSSPEYSALSEALARAVQ